MNTIKNVAALHDLATYGRCSLTCVIPVLSSMGMKVCPIPTAVYSSDTGGFGPVYARELTEEMTHIIEKLRAIPARFDCAYSGYLGSHRQAEAVQDFLLHCGGLRVVDPVMGDSGKLYSAFDESMVDVMRLLCRSASVITPNLTEAAILAELEGLKNGPITQEEVDDCRRGLLSSMDALGDSLAALENWYYGQITRGEPLYPPEYGKVLTGAVSLDEVRQTLQSYHYSVCYAVTAEPGTQGKGGSEDVE